MKTISVILLTVALFLESALISIPLILLVLLSLTANFRNNFMFLMALIFGALFDLLSLRTIGLSSIFFIIFTYIILIYQSKFEITTNTFIIFASFAGSLVYLLVFNFHSYIILESLISTILGVLIFMLVKRLTPSFKKHE